MSLPRKVPFSLLFFKSLSGLGIGIVGMVILLIFTLLGLGSVSGGSVSGPFLTFAVIIMGLVTALISNGLGVFMLGLLDQEKYPDIRNVIKHVIWLNILIFIFLLPTYFFVIIGTENNLTTIFLITTLQLLISAQASMLALDLSATENTRANFLAIYGVIFSMLLTIVVNLIIYKIGQDMSTVAELSAKGSGGKGATAVLFSILPVTWFFFGIFSTAVEMVYRWIYETWGVDFLNR